MDMINLQIEKDESDDVNIQTLFAEIRLNELEHEQTSSLEKNSTGVRIKKTLCKSCLHNFFTSI